MTSASSNISIRPAQEADRVFILSLSATLAEVAKFAWHADEVVQKFQDNYIVEMLDKSDEPYATYIADEDGRPIGFAHVRQTIDEYSGEACGTMPLLAVSPLTQGKGVGKMLMDAAETWSRAQGYRLLNLEVFFNNEKARAFYQKQGFLPAELIMVKPLK